MSKDGTPSLRGLDLSARADGEAGYKKERTRLQLELLRLQGRLRDDPRFAVIILFEGMDAAGKGGAIRRLTGRLDPRGYRVIPINAPDERERARHWLWRFQTRMPARGQIVIWDRSWYGRVLVERVDGLAQKSAWKRAYEEIAAFEKGYAADGAVLIKFWLHISQDEQLKRFRERENDPFKEYKIGPEDWHNREQRDAYIEAADDMFHATHRKGAPWTLVSGEDKRLARLQVLDCVVRRLREAFDDG